MPSPVDKYLKEVKKSNPGYSDEQAWATAWSIYCKHNPGSEHCHRPSEEYLKGQGKKKTAERVVERFLAASTRAAAEDEEDWEEVLNEVPDLVNTMSMIVGDLQVDAEDGDLEDEWDAVKALANSALEDLETAESVESARDLWANLKEAQKKADTLKGDLQKIRSKARKDKAVRDAIGEATSTLRSLLRDLDGLIP